MFDRFFKKNPKTFNVQIEPYGKTLLVDARETILEAALKSEIACPNAAISPSHSLNGTLRQPFMK